MTELDRSTFPGFFRAVYGREPFPWQRMLLDRVLDEGWPDLLDLPTASGKTACIDVSVFALAVQADLAWHKRTTARRIFFVVDRRIVVDEAYDRGRTLSVALRYAVLDSEGRDNLPAGDKEILAKIKEPNTPVLREVARQLCKLSSTKVPLAVTRLRGGIATDDSWAQLPTQPAIVTSTVDQVGSRMLFRSYGCSLLAAPIHAAMIAYDSLIVLDEAHCSVPFQQTSRAVCDYLDAEKWSEARQTLAPPLRLMIMTATPPRGLHIERPFPRNDQERADALNNELLIKRRNACKMATLDLVKGKAAESGDPLALRAAHIAASYVTKDRCKRVAVMVNRVRTAQTVAGLLRQQFAGSPESEVDIVLLTGQMRPIDRDDLVERWATHLKAGSTNDPRRPVILVTTQCLEVGADFSFDALVSECASLDALLQRFGRLDRLGELRNTHAAILTRTDDLKEANDRIYGGALAETWNWLGGDKAEVDFGIDAMAERRRSLDSEAIGRLLAPTLDAPVLMPAHVDLLCQTSPRPGTDPDIGAYLHGLGRGKAEVRVAFRVDLPWDRPPINKEQKQTWLDMVALCPPAATECLTVSLWKLQRYLGTGKTSRENEDQDVEGIAEEADAGHDGATSAVAFVVRGARDPFVSTRPRDIRPGDTVVLPAQPGGSVPPELGMAGEGAALDRADEAHHASKRRYVLRIHPGVLTPVRAHPAIDALFRLINQPDELPRIDDLRDLLIVVSTAEPYNQNENTIVIPSWLKDLCRYLGKNARRHHVTPHPLTEHGLVISIKPRRESHSLTFLLDEEEPDDLLEEDADADLSLDAHCSLVEDLARAFGRSTVPDFADILGLCGRVHDVGKLDERFQCLLNAALVAPKTALAKSEYRLPPARERELRSDLELPPSFRHEMASLQLLQCKSDVADNLDAESRELLLHIVAAHHGYGRPFVPVCVDNPPRRIDGSANGVQWSLSADDRGGFVPHRLNSGVTERFWRLTRRFGWWGLAYLEAQLRLADWHASEHPTLKVKEPVA